MSEPQFKLTDVSDLTGRFSPVELFNCSLTIVSGCTHSLRDYLNKENLIVYSRWREGIEWITFNVSKDLLKDIQKMLFFILIKVSSQVLFSQICNKYIQLCTNIVSCEKLLSFIILKLYSKHTYTLQSKQFHKKGKFSPFSRLVLQPYSNRITDIFNTTTPLWEWKSKYSL